MPHFVRHDGRGGRHFAAERSEARNLCKKLICRVIQKCCRITAAIKNMGLPQCDSPTIIP